MTPSGGQHQVGRHIFADRPADDPPTPHVEHDGQKDEAGPGRHVSHVRNPQLIGARGDELAVNHFCTKWNRPEYVIMLPLTVPVAESGLPPPNVALVQSVHAIDSAAAS